MRTILPRIFIAMTLTAFLSSSGCSTAEDQDPVADEEKESDGDALVTSLPEPTIRRVDAPALTAEERRRHEEVEAYPARRYRGYRIVETTQTYVGDIIDWFDPATVPGSQVEQPPKPSPEALRPSPGKELQRTELDLYPELRGPDGTIPILRHGFERYIRGETEARSIEDFVRGYDVPGQPAGQTNLYAGLSRLTPMGPTELGEPPGSAVTPPARYD